MVPPRKTHCKRGHPFTLTNTRIVTLKGNVVRQCKRCRAEYDRLRYHNDPERRARVLLRAKARYRPLTAEDFATLPAR